MILPVASRDEHSLHVGGQRAREPRNGRAHRVRDP